MPIKLFIGGTYAGFKFKWLKESIAADMCVMNVEQAIFRTTMRAKSGR